LLDSIEADREFKIPAPWRSVLLGLLLTEISDPEIHHIFDTIIQVEHAAGRL
jgi:hypothetical protein